MSESAIDVPGGDPLNPAQRRAADAGDGPLLIIAGAGTGKTQTLAHRVAALIARGADPRRILLLTFSRRAAQEMTRRAARLVDGGRAGSRRARPGDGRADAPAAAGLSWAGTFHRFIQPTAMTQPAGSLTYNNYELLLHGFTYGITDRVQTSVTVLSPIVKDMPLLGVAAAKWQFLSTPRFHMALQGSAGVIHVFGGSGEVGVGSSSSANAYLFGGGAFASYCLRDDCSSLASVNVTYQLGLAGSGAGDTAQVIVYGGSIVHRVSPHVKLLGEMTSLATRGGSSTGSNDSFDNIPGALVSYGVRFHTANIASDIGFMKPVSSTDDSFLLGLPFINVSYRWQ